MQSNQTTFSTPLCLESLLDEQFAGCDPDFDFAYEDLEREFAEFRCQLVNA